MAALKWLLAGASGFLGTAIRVRLASEGHDVVRLVRREPATSTEFRWDPDVGDIDPAAFDGVDVAVNLAGVAVAPSPVDGFPTHADSVVAGQHHEHSGAGTGGPGRWSPAHFDQMSGIARYGTTSGAEPHTEESPGGVDYLAQVTTNGKPSRRHLLMPECVSSSCALAR